MNNKTLVHVLITFVLFMATPVSAIDNGAESLRQTGKAFASVSRAVSPSVVFLKTETSTPGSPAAQFSTPFGEAWPFGDDLSKLFFGDKYRGVPKQRPERPRGKRRQIGQGSGFVFSTKDGLMSDKTYILTNNHVIDKADNIRVMFLDRREFDARITARDRQSDIAVIEIKAGKIPALTMGDSKLEVGEWVVAIGNPFGSHTLTVGVVSAKGRTSVGVNDYEDFIQTNAAINSGNSVGPLVSLDGEVVGVNTAIFSRSGGYMGVGFAIPSNLASSIAEHPIESGEVTRGYLGIVIQPLTANLAKSFDMEQTQGILIAQVSADSPAHAGGTRSGRCYRQLPGQAGD